MSVHVSVHVSAAQGVRRPHTRGQDLGRPRCSRAALRPASSAGAAPQRSSRGRGGRRTEEGGGRRKGGRRKDEAGRRKGGRRRREEEGGGGGRGRGPKCVSAWAEVHVHVLPCFCQHCIGSKAPHRNVCVCVCERERVWVRVETAG
eukprot:3938957-Rhodomonas_salina.3